MTTVTERQAQMKEWVKHYHGRLFGKDNVDRPLP